MAGITKGIAIAVMVLSILNVLSSLQDSNSLCKTDLQLTHDHCKMQDHLPHIRALAPSAVCSSLTSPSSSRAASPLGSTCVTAAVDRRQRTAVATRKASARSSRQLCLQCSLSAARSASASSI
jgi:hypothetical protein